MAAQAITFPTSTAQVETPDRYRLLLLHTLVIIVLSYQMLFSPAGLLSFEAQETIILVLMVSIAGLVIVPESLWARGSMVGALVLADTAITTAIIYLSGNANSNLYLAYFLIMLLAAFTPTLPQMATLSGILCAAYGMLLYWELDQNGAVDASHLLRIPALLILGTFYGVASGAVRTSHRDLFTLPDPTLKPDRTEADETIATRDDSPPDYATLLQHLPGMVYRCVHDPDRSMTFASQGCLALTGYSPEEFTRRKINYPDLIHHEDVGTAEHDIEVAIRAKEPYDLTYRLRIAPGVVKWVRDQGRGFLAEDGAALYLEGLVTDITEQKRAEEALKASRETYLRLLDEFPTPIRKAGVDAKCDYFNKSWMNFTGRTLEQETGDGWIAGVHPDDLERCLSSYLGAFQARQPFVMEYRLRRFDGDYRSIIDIGRPYYDPEGCFIGYIGSCYDITERKQAEEALRATEERFLAFMDNNPAVAFIKDPEGRYVYVNKPYERLFNRTRKEWEGKTDHELWPPKIAQQLVDNDRDVLAKGQPIELEEIVPVPDGGFRSYMTLKFPIRDTNGRQFVGGLAYDLTDRKLLEQQFRQAQKMEAVGQLAGGIAHDFNNLLTVIIGFTQMLIDKLGCGNPEYSELEEIDKAANRAAALTRQLLAFSRRQMLHPKVLNLNLVMSNLDKMLRRVIGEDLHLETLLSTDHLWVKVDQGQLEQVIMNLAVNGRDAMPRGGTLTVSTYPLECAEGTTQGRVKIKPGSYAVVEMRDTGHGMDPETQARIFEPFFTTKGQGKGTGLGLSTVYGIVKQSDGYVFVFSELGKGTTFKIYLPQVEEMAVAEAPKAEDQPAGMGTETVLVAEDEAGLRGIVRKILEQHGYTVLEAATGREALILAAQHQGTIDLLIADVIMPGGMNGRELGEQLTAQRPGLRVFFMTGYTEDAIIRQGILQNGVEMLYKPFSREALARKVRAILDDATDSKKPTATE